MAKLLSSLPIGATVKFGKHSINGETAQPIVWVVADKNHSGYPAGSVTLVTKQIIDIRAFDGVESNGTGNAYYHLSNLHQWLNSNKSAGAWYTESHSADKPPNSSTTYYGTQYEALPGLLYNFTTSEQNALMSTSLRVQSASGLTTMSAKVFLPSLVEVGTYIDPSPGDGSTTLPYFNTVPIKGSLTDQAYTYTLCTSKSSINKEKHSYWTRNTSTTSSSYTCIEDGSGMSPTYGYYGVRPVVNLSGDLGISTTADTNGDYTLSLTNAPTAPSNMRTTPDSIYTNKSCTVAWDGGYDSNGDMVGFRVQLYYDGVASGTPIEVGTATSYTFVVKSGVTSVGFGVDAYDAKGHYSSVTSLTKTVSTNNAPIISGSNGDLGIKNDGFSQTYSVSDADGGSVTVTEYIDNMKIRSYVATLNATNTFAVTGNTWLKLANGIHTLKITATDGIDESTRTFTFTKTVNTLVVQRVTPLESSTKPTRLIVTVVKSIPPEATFKVEACNNGFDTTPTWEDVTSSITKGQAHVFSNTAKTASKWGVNIRVTINRNGGAGACYITEIGGNFE